jgi:RNA polymerase sigma factor (sigma-70 family)
MPEDEIQLDIEGLRSRDENALRDLFDHLLPFLRQRAEWEVRRFGGHAMDADDLAHQALMKVYENLDRFIGDDSTPDQDVLRRLRSISFTILRNMAMDTYRRNSRRYQMECEHFDLERPQVDPVQLGITEIETAELLKEILSELSEEDRKLVELRFIEGRTLAEIAESQSVTKSTLYQRYRRIMEKLRMQFNQRQK